MTGGARQERREHRCRFAIAATEDDTARRLARSELTMIEGIQPIPMRIHTDECGGFAAPILSARDSAVSS
jgi:hypothetical protein